MLLAMARTIRITSCMTIIVSHVNASMAQPDKVALRTGRKAAHHVMKGTVWRSDLAPVSQQDWRITPKRLPPHLASCLIGRPVGDWISRGVSLVAFGFALSSGVCAGRGVSQTLGYDQAQIGRMSVNSFAP